MAADEKTSPEIGATAARILGMSEVEREAWVVADPVRAAEVLGRFAGSLVTQMADKAPEPAPLP